MGLEPTVDIKPTAVFKTAAIALLPLIRLVEPVGIEPTLPPCKGGVLPLNYGPMKNQGAPAPCRRPPRQGKHSTESNLPEIWGPPARCRRPRPRWQPFCLASAQTIAAPVPATTRGRAWSLPVRGWSFSLHPRRSSLRGGVKSETVVELFCRKSPGGVSHLPQRPQRSSPCLIRPPSRCAACLRSFPPSGYPPL